MSEFAVCHNGGGGRGFPRSFEDFAKRLAF